MSWFWGRVHPTWHVTAAFFGFCLGVLGARWVNLSSWLALGCGAALLGLALWKQRRILLVAALVAGGLFGMVRGSSGMHDMIAFRSYMGRQVTLRAVVADDADELSGGRLRLKLGSIEIGGVSLHGRVFATVVSPGGVVRRSDRVVISGLMNEGFGNFAASLTGEVKTVQRPAPGDVALNLRDTFAQKVALAVEEPAASLGTGYLLGKKSALSDDLVRALQIAGLTHIVVASGYNLTILVRAARRLLARVSKYLAAISGAGLILGFVMMTGMSATMMRAGLVAGLSLWAWYYGRRFHPVTLLGLAAALTLLIDPSFIWGDLGWMLSFAAFAGVMIAAPVMTHYFFGDSKAPFVGQLVIETLAAQLATLPIMVVAFHQLSVIALLANLLVLPLIPAAMALVAIAGLGAWVLPNFASIIGWPAETLLSLQLRVIEWCAEVPGALLTPEWGWGTVAVYAAIFCGVIGYMKWRTGYRLREASLVE